jgi:hypothetical protein
MPYDENGNFIRTDRWEDDKNAGINIITSHHDREDDNFANGLTQCVTRDGRGKFNTNVNFNNHKGIKVLDGQYLDDAVNVKQLLTGNNFFIDLSTQANKIEINTGLAELAELKNGQRFVIRCNNTNTSGNVTLKVNSISLEEIGSNIPVVLLDGLDLAPNAITAGSMREFLYYDKKFYIFSPLPANTLPLLSWFMTDACFDTTILQYLGYALQGSVCDGTIYTDAYDKLVKESENTESAVEKFEFWNTDNTEKLFYEITYKINPITRRRFYTKEEYEKMVEAVEGCMGYVLDTYKKTFTLPKSNIFARPNIYGSGANSFNRDQIINMKGQVNGISDHVINSARESSGVLSYTTSTTGGLNVERDPGTSGAVAIAFEAAAMTNTGKRVQPRHFTQFVYYIVGNTIINEGKIDLVNIAKVAEEAADFAAAAELAAQEAKNYTIQESKTSNYIREFADKIFIDYTAVVPRLIADIGLSIYAANGRSDNGDAVNTKYITTSQLFYSLAGLNFPTPQILCLNIDNPIMPYIENYSYYNHNENFNDADLPASAPFALWYLNSKNKTYKYSQDLSHLESPTSFDFSQIAFYDFTVTEQSGDIIFLRQTENFIIAFCQNIYLPDQAIKPVSDIFIADKNNPMKWYKNHIVYEQPITEGQTVKLVRYNKKTRQFYLVTSGGVIVKFFADGNEYEKTKNVFQSADPIICLEVYDNHVYCASDTKIFYSSDYGEVFSSFHVLQDGLTLKSSTLYYKPKELQNPTEYGIIFLLNQSYVLYSYSLGGEIKTYPTRLPVAAVVCGTNILYEGSQEADKTNLFYTELTPSFTLEGQAGVYAQNKSVELELDDVRRIGFAFGDNQITAYNFDLLKPISRSFYVSTNSIKDLLIVGTKLFALMENNTLERFIITPFQQVKTVPIATMQNTEQGKLINLNTQNNLFLLNAEQIKERLDGFIRDILYLKNRTDNALLPSNPPVYQNKWLFGADTEKNQIWVSLQDLENVFNDVLKKQDYTRIISLSEDKQTIYLKQGAQLEIADGRTDDGTLKQYSVKIFEDAQLNLSSYPDGKYLLFYIASEGFWQMYIIEYEEFEILNTHPDLTWNDTKGPQNYKDIKGRPINSLYFSKQANAYYYKNYTGGGLESEVKFEQQSLTTYGGIAADAKGTFLLSISNNIDNPLGIAKIINPDGTTAVLQADGTIGNFNVNSIVYGNGVWLCGGYGPEWYAPILRCAGNPRQPQNWSQVSTRGTVSGWDNITTLKFIDGIFFAAVNNASGIKKSIDNGQTFQNTSGLTDTDINIKDIIKTEIGLIAFDNKANDSTGKIYISTDTGASWAVKTNYISLGMDIVHTAIKHNGKWLIFGESNGARVCKQTTNWTNYYDYELAGGIIVRAAIKYGNKNFLFGGIYEYNPSLSAAINSDSWEEVQFNVNGHGTIAISTETDFVLVTSENEVSQFDTKFVKAPIIPIAKIEIENNSVNSSNIVSIEKPKNYPEFLDYVEKNRLIQRIESLEEKIKALPL